MEDGGTDTAPTPTELFAASLATCVAFSPGRHLQRHGLHRHGLRVRTKFPRTARSATRCANRRGSTSSQRHERRSPGPTCPGGRCTTGAQPRRTGMVRVPARGTQPRPSRRGRSRVLMPGRPGEAGHAHK
ncbi:OsmC family protein [Streptomyces canus]|uniref:OsmC family protein n=1 Tax=Streptomyces canus TaxID=58343 RepID=UPI00386B86A7|nr:OsmC family protein [Streptomyces canus]